MGNTLSCIPLKRKKGQESNFIRRNWRQLIKQSSRTKDKQGPKLGLQVTRIGRSDEEWELIDIEEDADCLSLVTDQLPSPSRLALSPCSNVSPISPRGSVSADLVDVEDGDLIIDYVTPPKGLIESQCLTRSPRSPNKIDSADLKCTKDDASCLTVEREHVPTPRRLTSSPCLVTSPKSPHRPNATDQEDTQDGVSCLLTSKEKVPTPRRQFVSPHLTRSPRSPRQTSLIEHEITCIEVDIEEDNEDKNSDSGKIIGSGDHYTVDGEDAEVKEDTETVREVDPIDYRPTQAIELENVLDKDYREIFDRDERVCSRPNATSVSSLTSGLSVVDPAVTDDDGENVTSQMYADIADLFEVILDRVEAAYAYREVSDDEDEGRLTPPQIEGDIYRGSGILKTTQFGDTSAELRRIAWHDDVKPPARDGPDLDPITAAFARERSNLLLQRTEEQKERLRIERRARKRHAKYCALMMIHETPQSRLPVRVKDWRQEPLSTLDTGRSYHGYKPVHVPTGCLIPVRIQPPVNTENATNNAMSLRTPAGSHPLPHRLDDIDTDSTRAYYIEQFKATELFKQRYRKKKNKDTSWTLGLTAFQCWVIENAGAAVTNTNDKRSTSKRRLNKAVPKISCWRRGAPASK